MNRSSIPNLRDVTRVLIIRLGAIGDVIHALPLASALKDAYPHLQISWLVEEIPSEVVLGNPDLANVIVVPRSRWKRGRARSPRVWGEYLRFLGQLRRYRFDLTIDLQGYAKTALYVLAAGARYRLGWHRLRDGANLMSRPLPRRPESVHRVDWFLDVARALGVQNPGVRFPIHVSCAARTAMSDRLAASGIRPGEPYVVMNQAAGNPPRRWGRDRFAALAAQLAIRRRLPTVLIGTAPEAEDCEAIVQHVRTEMGAHGVSGVVGPLNLAGATTLAEAAAVLDACALHVSGDTGSTHLAAALGIPVVAFYGSTDPAHAGPWGQLDHVLARRSLCSRECTVRKCAFAGIDAGAGLNRGAGHVADGDQPAADLTKSARCLEAITVDDALAMVDHVLGTVLSSTE